MSEAESGTRSIEYRHPKVDDGAAVWRLVADGRVLETNSAYAYLLLCRDFAETCVVARRGSALVGFVVGYRLPTRQDTVFVWQVGVSADARGEGVASRVLDYLLASDGCRGVRFLETTVTPSNEASRALFGSLARRVDTRLEESEGFPSELFPDRQHEPERRLRIGPFQISGRQS